MSTIPELVGYSDPATAAVGAASGVIVAANPLRRGVVITNLTAQTVVYLGIGADAVANSGIALIGAGGSWTMSIGETNVCTAVINALRTGGAATVAIQEIVNIPHP